MLASARGNRLAVRVAHPEGLFPQQDTGMITAITEASADISPEQMATPQRSVHRCHFEESLGCQRDRLYRAAAARP